MADKKEYWASYATDLEIFSKGPYDSIADAKTDIIDQYKSDMANGCYYEGEITTFAVGVRLDYKDIAKNSLNWRAESIIEDISCSVEDNYYMDDQYLPSTKKNIELMTKLLEKFFDECEFNDGFIVIDIQEFKFSEVV